ncbi:asparagine synthetase B family protein [Aurantiacibacter spongiae]|uniref:asparagine synthase (glutamine-hydrolyzing) n=1 Tax=Aurantiacibacter spongiae TaxID=2488860 RepID=A0A3N5CR49_9SPHN|nr:asparagine synthase-related protein [Aurantiacibacter spongiae]RPF71534.1 hypothetical protein EG799_07825 [Aurantiacibacter spongiae]
MSGIAAIFRRDGASLEPSVVEAMTDAMAYRGPDGISHWHGHGAAIGFCALHTTRQCAQSRQPLQDEAGDLVLAFAGYLANRDDLLRDLEQSGHVRPGRSDAELVMSGWRRWGTDLPRRLEGEFAFVVWDARRRMAYAARDHQGLRPLLYRWDGQTLVIASDMAALLAGLADPPALNEGYLAEIMADEWWSLDETVWSGVKRLEQAYSLTLRDGDLRLEEYWRLPASDRIRYQREEDYVEHYRQLLNECVGHAARTHRPLACEVSGGLDSSAVFAVAHNLEQEGRLPAPALRGYTLTGEPGSAADEIAYVEAIEDHLGVSIARAPLVFPDLFWFAERARDDRDMPMYPNSAMSLELEERMAADGCRVALNGHGGDHWLDGSRRYYRELVRERDWRNLKSRYADDAADLGAYRAIRLLLRLGLGQFLPPALKRFARRVTGEMPPGETGRAHWLDEPSRREVMRRAERYLDTLDRNESVSFRQRKHRSGALAMALELRERQLARNGLSSRSPMLSRRFIEFSAATPEHIRLRGRTRKFVHRRAMTGLLPPGVIARVDKAEFSETYYRHIPALKQRYISAPHHQGAAEILKINAIPELFADYCVAAIDEKPLWPLWGVYVGEILTELDASLR